MQLSLLESLSEAGRMQCLATAQRLQVRAGVRILSRGERAAGIYLVESGRVRVFHEDAQGSQRTLYRLRAGDACVLALNCTFTGLRYPADVDVEEDAALLLIDAATWRALFEAEPGARAFTVNLLASWVFDLLGVLDTTVSSSVASRLADELLEQVGPDGRVHITHAALAQHLGTAREVVSRHLSSWRQRGWIRCGRGWIEVLDVNALSQVED